MRAVGFVVLGGFAAGGTVAAAVLVGVMLARRLAEALARRAA